MCSANDRHSGESPGVSGQHMPQIFIVMGHCDHHRLVDSRLFHLSKKRFGRRRARRWSERLEHVPGESIGHGLEDVEMSIDRRQRQPSVIGGSEL